jgi:hypothetical protein
MFIVFIGIITCVYFFSKKTVEKQDIYLKNNLFIQGRVINIKESNNHSFGIILLALDSANVKEFHNTLDLGVYPYKVKNGKAELYTFIPDGISEGDKVIVNSNSKEAVYYYVKSKQQFRGSIKVLSNSIDINYVKENTIIK